MQYPLLTIFCGLIRMKGKIDKAVIGRTLELKLMDVLAEMSLK